MTESTLIKAEENTNVFVDAWDDGGVWLSIHMPQASANCTLTKENARAMIEALKAAIGETE